MITDILQGGNFLAALLGYGVHLLDDGVISDNDLFIGGTFGLEILLDSLDFGVEVSKFFEANAVLAGKSFMLRFQLYNRVA